LKLVEPEAAEKAEKPKRRRKAPSRKEADTGESSDAVDAAE